MNKQWTKQELCELLGVSMRSVQNWTNTRDLPHTRLDNLRVLYDPVKTKKWLLQNFYALKLRLTYEQLLERLG